MGKVKRGREKQMMKEKMIKTLSKLQKQNCSVLVGLLSWNFGSCLKKSSCDQKIIKKNFKHPDTHPPKEPKNSSCDIPPSFT